jgi:chemotaxis regulatin CheY-phosphate phosphatase CheZ
MAKERVWSYRNFRIVEGLKPESEHFQYFYIVTEKGEKKCTYCVWIDDVTLSRFGRSDEFEEIASSRREQWGQWVREKIDQGDFRNLVLSMEEGGKKEIDLGELEEKLRPK